MNCSHPQDEDQIIVAITGANGFLGRHITQAAVQRGWKVHGIVRSEKAAEVVEHACGLPFIVPTFNMESLLPAIKGCRAIIHAIGITGGSEDDFQSINVGYAKKILEVAKEAKIARLITPSGLGVDQVGKKDWANNPYFRSKLEIESIFQASSQDFVIFRPSYIIGPGDELIPYMIQQMLEGTVHIVGNGLNPIQPIYIEDVATAFLSAAQGNGLPNRFYDLVGPEIIKFRDLIDLVALSIAKIQGKNPIFSISEIDRSEAYSKLGMSKEDADVAVSDSIGDSKPLCDQLQLRLTPLQDAVDNTVHYELSKYGI
jgi:NADH dehydrogenase